MGEPRRWTITYTKHVHQKRKVYHDGILELDDAKNKVFLYDDDEKLLGSRFLKKDEVVGNGETLAFDSYIVDIGECKGRKPLSDVAVNNNDKRSNETLLLKWQYSLHNSSGDDAGRNNTVDRSAVRGFPFKRKCSENMSHVKEELKNSLPAETESTDTSQVMKIPSNARVYRNLPFRDVSQILSRLQKGEEGHDLVVSSEKQVKTSRFSSPFLSDQQKKNQKSLVMIPDAEQSRAVPQLGHEDLQNLTESTDCHIAAQKNIALKSPDPQCGRILDDSLSPTLSSGSLALASELHKNYPMSPGSTTNMPDSCINEASRFEAPCGDSGGRVTTIGMSNLDSTSFLFVKEKESLSCGFREPSDLRASCDSTQIFSHAENEISNQHSAVSSNVREETENLPLACLSSSSSSSSHVQSSPSLVAAKKRPLDDIPSFDLGI